MHVALYNFRHCSSFAITPGATVASPYGSGPVPSHQSTNITVNTLFLDSASDRLGFPTSLTKKFPGQ